MNSGWESNTEESPFERTRPISVLVVEDETDLRTAIRDLLFAHGFAVTTAQDGGAGAELASLGLYDVIVSDIRMPRMNGTELARKARLLAPAPRIILMTAYPESYQEVERDKDVSVLHKPFKLSTLLALVKKGAAKEGTQGHAPDEPHRLA